MLLVRDNGSLIDGLKKR